jgi:2-polyprenyl-6-methoxyphenol hydroxylase-like FAD-dependent oxidoreductase
MKVLICGAGIAGLTLAWCLERLGHEPLVVERAPHLRDEGYMIDFFGSGCDAAERLGILPDLAAIHYPIQRLVFVNASGRERFSVAYLPLRRRLFADRHFNFLRGDLERALYRRFGHRHTIRFGTTVAWFEQKGDAVSVALSDGSEMRVDLLIGADGVHSHVRTLAFGDEQQFARLLGYEMAAFILESPLPGVGHDRFVTMTRPQRQVAVYPIRGGRMATFFLHASDPADGPGVSSEGPYETLHGRCVGDGTRKPRKVRRDVKEVDGGAIRTAGT